MARNKRPKKQKRQRGHKPKAFPGFPDGLIAVFGNQNAQAQFNKDFKVFVEKLPRLWGTITGAIKLIGSRDMTRTQMMVVSLTRMAFEDFRQILLLFANTEVTGAMKILRGMFERVTIARYLQSNPDKTEAFINFFPISQYREALAAGDLISPERLAELKAEKEQVLKLHRDIYEVVVCDKCEPPRTRINHTWSKTDIVTMAKKTGLSLPLLTGYYFPMQEAHATMASIGRRVNLNEETQVFTYEEIISMDEQRMVLTTAHYLALAAIEPLRGSFNLAEAIQDQLSLCVRDFKQVLEHSARENSQSSEA